MKNSKQVTALYSNTRHLTKVIVAEFTYCILIFFCFLLIAKNTIAVYQDLILVVYVILLFVVPFGFNLFQIFKFSKQKENGKVSNYIITTILLINLMLMYLLK